MAKTAPSNCILTYKVWVISHQRQKCAFTCIATYNRSNYFDSMAEPNTRKKDSTKLRKGKRVNNTIVSNKSVLSVQTPNTHSEIREETVWCHRREEFNEDMKQVFQWADCSAVTSRKMYRLAACPCIQQKSIFKNRITSYIYTMKRWKKSCDR